MSEKPRRRRHAWKAMLSYGWQKCECGAVHYIWGKQEGRPSDEAPHLPDGTPKTWCDRKEKE